MASLKMEYKSTPEYNELINELHTMLSGDNQSVSNQLLTMSDNHLVYQMINFCRGFEASSSKNTELANFIDQSYACFQITAIRGLSDDNQRNSLSLINTIHFLKKQRTLLTRENYVCHNDHSYFFEEEEKQFIKEQMRRAEQNPGKFEVIEAGGWLDTKRRHEYFDRLAFTANISDRETNDMVDDRVFKRLLGELKKCHDIGALYANTMVTHKQNIEGRRILTDRDINLTINQISMCHQILWTVFNTINSYFLQTGLSPIISKISNRFDCLDEAWVRPDDNERYIAELDRLSDEMDEKLSNLVDNFMAENS